jgi:hypothetical protein
MHQIHSYSKIYHIGHPLARGLIGIPLQVEEKIDGSQFSMMKREDGTVVIKSKQVEMDPYNPNGMFSLAAKTALVLDLRPGWVYRGEYLQSPKHNTLHYMRVPKKNIILFDIEKSLYNFLSPEEREEEADRLGLESVSTFGVKKLTKPDDLLSLLENNSILGNEKVEGVVLKPVGYKLFGSDGKVVMGKYVREDFKERNSKNWKTTVNPGKNMIIENLVELFTTDASKQKALQRLKENDELESHPRDIPKIIKEIKKDLREEWEEEIKERLYKWAIDKIEKGVCKSVPEWYKKTLVESAFAGDNNE